MNKIYLAIAIPGLLICGQSPKQSNYINGIQKSNMREVEDKTTEAKMKIEIWSDVMCPFCYIGKRKFEMALSQSNQRNNIQVEWKSFQLSPDLKTESNKSLNTYLAEHKGISIEQAKAMNDHVIQLGKQVGLVYNLDMAIPANSFKAHQLIHFAKGQGRQNEAEEVLFRSYFTDGKNIDDLPTLLELGEEIGLDRSALKNALEKEIFADEVKADINEAQLIGVPGVPFFVFNRKYAVSGAQQSNVFLETLEKSIAEWEKDKP